MSDKEQRIRTRAYEIWEREGRHDGWAEDHWRRAELEVEQEKALDTQTAEAAVHQVKTAGKRASPSIKATQTEVDATGSEEAAKKPIASRKKAATDAKPPRATKKTAATRSRQTPS
jgi:Protein of unknown function (DUF2934)